MKSLAKDVLAKGSLNCRAILNNKPPQQSITYITVRWKIPEVSIKKNFVFLGIEKMDPVWYEKKYGPSLLDSKRLPKEAKFFSGVKIRAPPGEILASDIKCDSCNPNLSAANNSSNYAWYNTNYFNRYYEDYNDLIRRYNQNPYNFYCNYNVFNQF